MASRTLPGGNSSLEKSSLKLGNKNSSTVLPIYMKYAKSVTQNWLNPSSRLKPSDLVKPSIDVAVDDYPMIVEFNNMPDNTSHTHSVVDIDHPLFQPSPTIVVFEEYDPFSEVQKKIFFRNKDAVARRIKIVKPDSPFFDVSAPRNMNGEPLKQSKIASGMEVYFVLTFKPQEVRDYSFDLVCSTEREKFLVPIRAVGMRPKLTLPDEVDFGSCPIKAPSQRKLSVQNVGTAVARFTMSCANPEFTCPTQDITIEAGATESIELNFTPTTINPAVGEIEVHFLKGVTCYIALSGVGKNADVSLSTPSLTLEPSYISLLSQKSLKIRNLSDAPISYSWKSFSNEAEEESERDRLLMEINRMEAIEQDALRRRVMDGYYGTAEDDDEAAIAAGAAGLYSSGLGDTEESFGGAASYSFDGGMLPFAAKADEAVLVRKYRNLRKALEKDNMQFVDDIFEITPIEGQVWANSELEITVVFRPDTAAQYNCLTYLDVSGRHDRLSLQLTGQGIGPHAALSFDVLDIGDVFINDEMFYEVSIKNKGDIPAHWTFMSSLTKFGNKFSFSPTEGQLQPNQSQSINIRFESDILGEFAEHFRFALQGNEDMLICQIKGHVVGPNFHFDCNSIDFGTVSFDYLHSTTVRMVNTSKIPMVYSLRIPQDGTYLKREFNIEPSRGTLAPKESVEVLIEFIPNTVKEYDYSLAVDVLGVGEMLLSVPITANCIISTVKLELSAGREIDFGDCFIRYPYERVLTLTNMSAVVHTKFEIPAQPTQTKSVASYETDPSIAVIEPSDSMDVKVRLVTQKLGLFKVPMLIQVAGSKEPPIQAVLAFNTVGPKVTVDSTELRWGSIECLKDCPRLLRITNEGLITASMKLFLKLARSCYRIDVHELVLEAHQSFDLQITANLDDCVVNKDEVHIVVEEGDNLMVPLLARGMGTTMYCQQDIHVMDLGVQLTTAPFEKQIVLENKGRRPQQLRWYNKTVKLENAARAAKLKKTGKEVIPGQRLPKHLAPVDAIFSVQPEEITLRPRTATTFTFRGSCSTPRDVSERFVLESKVGKERYFKEIIETDARCRIVNPLLEFSQSSVAFCYSWQRGVDAATQTCPLTLTNTSDLPLSFVLKTEVPFNLNAWDATLQPGQQLDLIVEFDPIYRDDKQSHVVDKSLVISYRGHPQKDSIPLRGEVIFPNLKFDLGNSSSGGSSNSNNNSSAINFGCVLNDTLKTLKVRATNSCKIDVNYEWTFLESAATKQKSRAAGNTVPPNQVFDILPVKSLLRPGQQEDIEFSMYGTPNAKFHGSVICAVEGGPEYKFSIAGEASTVGYELSRSVIDFGRVVFTDKGDQELEIVNLGKVPFSFEVAAASVEAAMVLDIIPSSGKVAAAARGKIVVRVRPALPARIHEQIIVRVAHFDPVVVDCYCDGVFPTAIVALPRYKKLAPYSSSGGGESSVEVAAEWDSFHAAAVQNLMHPDLFLRPPSALPAAAAGSTALPPVYELPLLPPLPPEDLIAATDDDAIAADMMSVAGGAQQSLGAGSTKGVSHALLDVEMQRVVVCHELTRRIRDLRPSSPSAADRAQSAAASAAAGRRAGGSGARAAAAIAARPLTTATNGTRNSQDATAAATPRFGLQALMYKSINLLDVTAASYICDFGNVIVGQTRKKVFKITNASLVGQLNWFFEKSLIAAAGFSIEPEKISKMAENTTLDFTVKFFARHNQKMGPVLNKLPLLSAGSPALQIMLAANVCIPDIDLSSAALDFERVLLGQSKKMYVRFTNPTPVTTSWSVKKSNSSGAGSSSSGGSRSEQRFTLEPSSGSLRPGKKMLICVEFLPAESRKYSAEIVLKIENNKKNKSLLLTGEGFGAALKFDPPLLSLGPVLPFAAGDEAVVTVFNTADVAVEFFSLDFDTVHREEEAVLSQLDATMFDEHGLLRTAVRAAGAPLPAEILEAFAASQTSSDAAVAATAVSSADAVNVEAAATAVATSDGAETAAADATEVAATTAAAASALLTPVLRTAAGARDSNVHQDIVVFGAPVSGVSSQAAAVAKKLQLLVRSFDRMIEEVALCDSSNSNNKNNNSSDGSNNNNNNSDGSSNNSSSSSSYEHCGFVARLVTKTATAVELQQHEEKEALLQQAAEQSKIEAADAFKKEKKGKVKEIPEEVYRTAQVLAHEEYVAATAVNVHSLAQVLRYRLSWADAADGFVYDGVYSQYVNASLLLQAVQAALPHAVLAHLKINRGEEGYCAWLASLYEAQKFDLDRLKKSIENYRKLGKKTGGNKGKRRGTAAASKATITTAATTATTTTADTAAAVVDTTTAAAGDFPEALPTGEEQWLNHVTGEVMELEVSEFKSLEEAEKSQYLSQLLFQHSARIQQIEKVLVKLDKIWSAESGLKFKPTTAAAEVAAPAGAGVDATEPVLTTDATAATATTTVTAAAAADRVVYYSEYVEDVLPALELMSKGTYGAAPAVVEVIEAVTDEAAATTSSAATAAVEVNPPAATVAAANGEAATATAESPQQLEVATTNNNSSSSSGDYGGVYELLLDGEESAAGVAAIVAASLPPPKLPPRDRDALPAAATFQIFKKTPTAAASRPQHRKQIRLFRIAAAVDGEVAATEEEVSSEEITAAAVKEAAAVEAAAAAKKKGGGGKAATAAATDAATAAAAATAESAATAAVAALPQFRWVIPAHGSVKFTVKFAAAAEGKSDASLEFAVVGTQQQFSLPCRAICELPRINADSRNVFLRRVRGVNPSKPLPQRKFAIADNFYSFGPLSLYKKPEWKQQLAEDAAEEDVVRFRDIESTNMDIVRITNTGPYKCKVDLGLLEPNTAAPADAATTAAATADAAVVDSVDGVFLVEPRQLELAEGETKEARIWALPRRSQQYSNTLLLCVHDNPAPILFPLQCWGVTPAVDITGPWLPALAAAETAVAQNTDKKLQKDLEAKLAALRESLTIDFSRILTKKSDTREFTIRNTCLLPVDWEIDLGDFQDSLNIKIDPPSGTLAVNETLPVTVTFTSPEPMLLQGKFTLRYSDHEGGLHSAATDVATTIPAAATGKATGKAAAAGNTTGNSGPPSRVVSTTFAVVAEAYEVQAVSLNSAGGEDGGSEIDFGLLRVGDFAVQSMKMGNLGKYKIGFDFQLTTAAAAALLKIEPSNGFIDAGAAPVDIKVTFCAKTAAVHWKNNKDVMVNITEPLTGEVVEKFPMFLSAVAKYSKFRLQPSKGISFGALRFDAAAKTKSVELRNEGDFEVCYCVLPAQSESDELDALDAAALACYAHATPAAMRATELGDGYLQRINGGGSGGGKAAAAAAKKAPAKGKAGAATTTESSSLLNALVRDPDELTAAAAPADALAVGAFSVSPRIALVQPGQAVTIDFAFDPLSSSGSNSNNSNNNNNNSIGGYNAKEYFRICVSGADPRDSLPQQLRKFEVSGESCAPALVTDDFYSIFEEQEIVHSLCESTGDKESEGGGKLERLPVGKVVFAEQEKMLAFGPVICSNNSSSSSSGGAVGATTTATTTTAVAVSAASGGRGVVERVRISNPTKIDIAVKFQVLTIEQAAALSSTAAAAAAGKKDAKSSSKGGGKAAAANAIDSTAAAAASVFSVHPERWEIPPHEHRYVNVYFNPTEIKSYRSVFHAFIDDAGIETSAATTATTTTTSGGSNKKLLFELGGSGTLPCIAFEQPSQLTTAGNLLLNFGSVLVERQQQRQLLIRNDGVMPATCLFNVSGDEFGDFEFPASGTSLTVQPAQKETLTVRFKPRALRSNDNNNNNSSGEEGMCRAMIKVSVLNNPFDAYCIELQGNAYKCDALINTAPAAAASDDATSDTAAVGGDVIHFADINLADSNNKSGGSSSHTFTITSSCNEPLKFELTAATTASDATTATTAADVLTFSPSVGHLAPGGSREVTATFAATAPVKLDAAVVNCTMRRIRYLPVAAEVQLQQLQQQQQQQQQQQIVATTATTKTTATASNDDDREQQQQQLMALAAEQRSLWGSWDNSMKSVRPATDEDIAAIAASALAWREYNAKVDAEKAKGKKAKPVGPPPAKCLLQLAPTAATTTAEAAVAASAGDENGGSNALQNVYEIVAEPAHEEVSIASTTAAATAKTAATKPAAATTTTTTTTTAASSGESVIRILCNGVADFAKYSCEGDGENVTFKPTFLFQSTTHKFSFTNESNIALPVKWRFDNAKRRAVSRSASRAGTAASVGSLLTAAAAVPEVACPFFVEPEECVIAPNATQQFEMKFFPIDVDDFLYVLRGDTLTTATTTDAVATTAAAIGTSSSSGGGAVRMIVRGTAKRPICHFDVAETRDYMSRRPLNMKNENGLNSPIEVTDIKVVELDSVGLKTRNTFRFHITNPTSDNYEFLWEPLGEQSPSWRCVQSAGKMHAGKRVEAVFEYLPDDIHVAESFYRFRIPSVGLQQVFLFTGKVTEPKVQFSQSRLDFHAVMLRGEGSSETIYLENKEHLPFNFSFDKYSLLQLDSSSSSGPVLDIRPKEGTVAPHSKTAIYLHFQPQEEVAYNFNILCNVKRKPNKLSLNIKGEGYAVHPVIQLEQTTDNSDDNNSNNNGSGGRYLTLKPAPAVNFADFGSVQVQDSVTKTLTLLNSGKYNFDYAWDVDNISSSTALSLSGGKLGGTLLKAEEVAYKLTFAPQREGSIDNSNNNNNNNNNNSSGNRNSSSSGSSCISLTIAGGKLLYNIFPRGVGVKPALRFSFLQHDFGACFTTSPGGSTVIEETTLLITNNDPQSNISVECAFQKTRALWAECAPTVIAAGAQLQVVIRFAPREVRDYAFVLPFIVNGSAQRVNVAVSGSGVNARLELVNGSQRRVNFGAVDVGAEVTKIVAIVNKSTRALPVQLLETGDYGSGALSDRCITFAPTSSTSTAAGAEVVEIPPRQTLSLQLRFQPHKRVAQFNEELLVRYAGVTRTLLTVSGKAQGAEVHLDSDSLPFGKVVLDSQKVKKLTLENSGDLTITFQWIESSFGRHFRIAPLSGKVLAGSAVSFDVAFKPQFADADIRQDNMLLQVLSSAAGAAPVPLQLTCTGACVLPPTGDDVSSLAFNSLARKAQSKNVKIDNTTEKDWYLSPSLQGDDWKVQSELKVPAKSSADLAVTYFPLTMTKQQPPPQQEQQQQQQPPQKQQKKQAAGAVVVADAAVVSGEQAAAVEDTAHSGQLFIALPDGSALLYKLRGEAGAPECEQQLTVDTPAKTAATVVLSLKNWLSDTTQRFDVSVQLTEQPSPATFIVAANATEVGPNGTKEFPIRFVSFCEGTSRGRITFTNPRSGEYAYFDVTARAGMPQVQETFSVESPVRQTARCIVAVENPLPADVAVTMGSIAKPDEWWSCDCPYIRVNELSPLSGNHEGSFEVEYRPLVPTLQPQEHLLTIITQQLGTFKYKLVVKATPPLLKQMLRFSAVPLGSMQSESFVFRAYNSVKSTYSCEVQKPGFFSVEKSQLAVEAAAGGWQGDEVRLNVMFEPTEIGDVSDVLTVRSPEGGEYICELIGHCVPPTPQGPFLVEQGKGAVDIPFRNCFAQSCSWSFSVDNSAFRLTTAAAAVTVAAKTQSSCSVVFEPSSEQRGEITGKLFISCTSIPNIPSWVYYLRGKVNLEAAEQSAGGKGKKK